MRTDSSYKQVSIWSQLDSTGIKDSHIFFKKKQTLFTRFKQDTTDSTEEAYAAQVDRQRQVDEQRQTLED